MPEKALIGCHLIRRDPRAGAPENRSLALNANPAVHFVQDVYAGTTDQFNTGKDILQCLFDLFLVAIES